MRRLRALTIDREFVGERWLAWLKLMGVLAVAFALNYQWGRKLEREAGIKLKSHGQRTKRIFRQGLESLHQMLHLPVNLADRFPDFLNNIVRRPLAGKIVV